MKQYFITYGLIFLLGIIIGGSITWYIVDDFIDRAKLEAEQKFNDLLFQEKSKYLTEFSNLKSSKEKLKNLTNLTQSKIDSLTTTINNRTRELDKLKKDYNDKVSKIDDMSHNELTTFFSNRYGY